MQAVSHVVQIVMPRAKTWSEHKNMTYRYLEGIRYYEAQQLITDNLFQEIERSGEIEG